ncbi:uncharacterized protein [Amphiura filiformis]|uniref:uncharacterized protein n=1 Tax=Amphiura filiformis TaxID=82378 RepID=UPI003B218D33
MTSVGRQVSAKDFDLSMVNDWVQSCTQQENVILMDNADELLQPLSLSRDHFMNMMLELMSTQNPKVKIIITSRYAMRRALRDKPNYEEIEVKALQVRESIRLLVKECQMAPGGEKTIAEDTAKEIAHHCGNNPQALRAVAKRLKSGTRPERIAEMLRKPHLASRVLDPGLLGSTSLEEDEQEKVKQNLVLQTLKTTFEMLPERLQEALVQLSVFPGSFDRHKAKVILGMEDIEAVDLDIDDLLQWGLVECEEFRGFEFYMEDIKDRQFTIHPLVRTICMVEGMKGEKHNAAFVGALDRMCEYVTNLMEELATEGHTDYTQALTRFEEEKPIVTNYLEMDMGETFGGFKIASPLLEAEDSAKERARLTSSKFAESIYHLFECFMDVQKLEQFFRCKVQQMKDKNEMEAWALLSGWLADQYMVQAKYSEAYQTLVDPMNWLKSLPEPLSRDAELARAQCLAIQGRYLSDNPDHNYKEAIKVLEQSLSIRKKHLGDNSLTARCLNFLGHVYHRKGDDASKTKSYHEQAWEMLARITNGHPEQHFDAPTFALNIGSAYHQLGNTEMDKRQTSKAKEYYRHAISFYDKAQEIEKRLRLEGNPNTAVILKNKAMSYCEMEEYENALPLAVRSAELRKKGIGTHPDTARSLYFVGSLYHDLGKKERKASKAQAEEIPSFQDAMKYYKEALKYEWKLGKDRRSWEYPHLKEDFMKLLKQMHEDPQPYQRLFHKAEEGSFEGTMPEKPKADEDDGANTSSGSPKRKLTGLEDLPESPKRSKCVLA